MRLHRVTNDPADPATASGLADEALARLGENGWLEGHPAKRYHKSTNGVVTHLCAVVTE